MSKIAILLATAAALIPSAALAQEADDIVVMRRVIAPKDPNYEPPPRYAIRPTTARTLATTYPFIDGRIPVDTTQNAACFDSKGNPAPADRCAGMTSPKVGTIAIPAQANVKLRRVLIDGNSLKSQFPDITSAQDLCNATIQVNGPALWSRGDLGFSRSLSALTASR